MGLLLSLSIGLLLRTLRSWQLKGYSLKSEQDITWVLSQKQSDCIGDKQSKTKEDSADCLESFVRLIRLLTPLPLKSLGS